MPDYVQPGDILSSSGWNSLLDRIDTLEQKIAALETGVGIGVDIIQGFDPPLQQAVGSILTMKGKFDFPPVANQVTVEGVAVTSFLPLSSDLQLAFTIPTAISVAANSSRNVRIRVTNSRGSDEKTYKLLPQVGSTVPPPSISSILDQAAANIILNGNQNAVITGTNFAANPAENVVRVHLQFGNTTVTYPKPGDPPLAIVAANSNPTQIVFTVPVVTEIGLNTPTPVAVSVTVGSAQPAFFGEPNQQLRIRRQ